VIVLDASVALAWCFTDEQSSLADAVVERLRSDRAIVPAIWPFEVGNALLSAERRGRLDAADRARLIELLTALPIDVEPASLAQALGSLTNIARPNQLSVYDAAYIDVALRLALPLATLDRRLAQVAAELGVEVVGPTA
jgi:predicted nucleic acid-binding protein